MKHISFYLEENDSADPKIKDPQIFLESATTTTSIFWPQSQSELSQCLMSKASEHIFTICHPCPKDKGKYAAPGTHYSP